MGTSATRAKNKYNKANYDQYLFSMPKGYKERYMEIARQHDMSLSTYIIQALEEKNEREK